MKKRLLAMLMMGILTASTLAGCGTTDDANKSAETQVAAGEAADTGETGSAEDAVGENSDGQKEVVLSLGNAADYYIGTMVGATVEKAFIDAGANVQVLDAGDDVSNQINQIQNAVSNGVDIIYIFPAGDGETYYDVLQTAKSAGVQTIVSNNYPGEGGAAAYVGSDEFQMGVMMAAMVSEWADETFPDAGAGEIGVLAVESTFNQNAIKRCLGMRMVGERFLRKADMASVYFVKEDGEAVTYIDESGSEVEVDEPTGGLILDEEGHAQLNPYYNEKVRIIEYSNRNSAGTDSAEAQNALENAITMGETDLKAVMSYGDTGAALETKMRELCADGRLTSSVEEVAVFCSDLTDTNKDLILKSASNESVLRGVMAAGDLIATLCERAASLVNGEEVPEYTMEPLSYIMVNDDGSDVETVSYADSQQLPETDLFFK